MSKERALLDLQANQTASSSVNIAHNFPLLFIPASENVLEEGLHGLGTTLAHENLILLGK